MELCVRDVDILYRVCCRPTLTKARREGQALRARCSLRDLGARPCGQQHSRGSLPCVACRRLLLTRPPRDGRYPTAPHDPRDSRHAPGFVCRRRHLSRGL